MGVTCFKESTSPKSIFCLKHFVLNEEREILLKNLKNKRIISVMNMPKQHLQHERIIKPLKEITKRDARYINLLFTKK